MRARKSLSKKSVCDYDRRVIIIVCTCTLSLLKTNFTRRTFFHHLYTNRCSLACILDFMFKSKFKEYHLHCAIEVIFKVGFGKTNLTDKFGIEYSGTPAYQF